MISKSDSELTFKKSMNLQVRTREIDIFKLQSPIAEVVKRTIRFQLGKAEGIKMDEPFFVGE